MADFRHKHEDADRDFRCGLEQLVRGHIDGCMTAALASCSSAEDDDPSPDGPDLARRRRRSDLDGDDLAETSAAARRHSRILSRWVARQAEEMITTIERRNRESELMALAGLHTVSMLDSSFLREPRGGAAAQTVERPVSARASSILQRWRELEDESAAQRQSTRITPHSPTNRNAGQLERQASSEDVSVSDATTEYSRWPPGAVAESDDDRTSSLEQSVGDGERERVRQIVRGWTVDSGTTDASSRVSRRSESPRAEWLGERERERVRLVREWVQTASQQRDVRASGREERGHEVIQSVQPEQIQRDLPRLRGRQARLDLITRIAGERQRELQHLSEHRVVSDFTHRNRIQSLLRGRFLRNGRPSEDERPPSVAARELGQLRQRNPVSGLREGFRHRLENIVRGQANGHSGAPVLHNVNDTRNDHSQSNAIVEETIDERAQFQSRSENNEIHQTIRSENNEVHEMTRSENIEIHQTTETHVTAGLQISSNNVGWQESVTQRENLREEDADNGRSGWQPSPEVEFSEWGNDNEEELDQNWNETTDEAWSREIPEDEDGGDSHILEPHEEWHEEESQRTLETWHHGPSPSQRDEQSAPIRRISRFVPPDDDNVYSMELRELLSRRSVSNLLHSRFRESLDQLIQSYVQRQDRTTLDWDLQRTVDDPDSPDEDQSQHRDDLNQDQQESDARPPVVLSTPPVPPPQPLWHSEFHRGNWTRPSMHRSEIEWDISDLRADISRLQQGMNNMQRMLEACMDMQLELQRSVRQEVSAALNRSIGEQGAVEEVAVDGSKWTHVRKGTCCVCCDSHIDALLYRCGHMCTCSKCAHELVRSGDKCPLCRAPIAEVIRAYSIL